MGSVGSLDYFFSCFLVVKFNSSIDYLGSYSKCDLVYGFFFISFSIFDYILFKVDMFFVENIFYSVGFWEVFR